MKTFFVMLAVFVGLAIFVEYAYLRCLAEVKKMHFRLPTKSVSVKRSAPRTFIGRPELDFDLNVRKVDKIRFGDEA